MVKKAPPEKLPPPKLVVTRAEARAQLESRIEKGRELRALEIGSKEELDRAQSERSGVPMSELAYDALLARDGTGSIYVPVTNFEEGDLGAVREMLTHPFTIPGLGDAGAHSTMICDASFPTYLLSYWANTAPQDQRLPVEWVVKRQCADTAAFVGLLDRGVLAPGYRADVNVIDIDRLAIGLPEMQYDLPANGKRLVQHTRGYVATLVAGEVVCREGEPTGALPGRLVRGAQAAPVEGAPAPTATIA